MHVYGREFSSCCSRHAAEQAAYPAYGLTRTKPNYPVKRGARVEHIALDIRLDHANDAAAAGARIRFTAIEPRLSVLKLDCRELRIRAVQDEQNNALEFTVTESQLEIRLARPLAAGERGEARVGYEIRKPRLGMYFIHPDADHPRKPDCVWTQGQDDDSPYWFPCIDQPLMKHTAELRATVPGDWFALSNGALMSDTRNPDGTRTLHWSMAVPLPAYLMSLVAGRYAEVRDSWDGIPVNYYVYPGREQDGERSFGVTPKIVEFFSRFTGVRYPYVKYAQIVAPDYIFGGMEHTTCTTQTDATLHDARAHLDFSSDPLNAHELAHQWFGDLVTCKHWSHGWLNEGFATYFEALWREHSLGLDEFRLEMIDNAENYFAEDKSKYRRAIVTNQWAEPQDLFDRHLYEKGSLVLHMLRGQLGDDIFRAAIRRYLETHREGAVETVDLQRGIEAVAGDSMDRFFEQWVFMGGHPDFDISITWDAERNVASLRVKQTQKPDALTALFDIATRIRIYDEADSYRDYDIRVHETEQTFHFALPRKPRLLRFDPGNWILKTTSVDMPLEMLRWQARHEPDVTGRIQAAAKLGQLGSPEAVEILRDMLLGDAFWGVQKHAARALGEIRAEAALDALLTAVKIPHPKARRAVAEVLGNYRQDRAAQALKAMLHHDDSYFVEAAAAHSLGKTRAVWTLEELQRNLHKESWAETVRSGILNGMAELQDPRAIGVAMPYLAYKWHHALRGAAMKCLAAAGRAAAEPERIRVRETLVAILDERRFRATLSTLAALTDLNDSAAVPAIETVMRTEINGFLKQHAERAAKKLRDGADKGEDIQRLRKDLDKAVEQNYELRKRLDKLEQLQKPRPPVEKPAPAAKTKPAAAKKRKGASRKTAKKRHER